MKKGYSFEYSEKYIQIIHSDDFVANIPTFRQLLEELAEFCKINNCKKVLVFGNLLKRKMKTVEAFELGNLIGSKMLGLWLACVFPEYESDETTEFFKTVSKNRGVRVEFFQCRTKALEWLNVSEKSQIIKPLP